MDVDDEISQQTPSESASLRITGKVVGIIKRNWRPYCGTIEIPLGLKGSSSSSSAQNVFFWAMDKRIPKIRIRTRQLEQLAGRRIIVAIDSWSKNSR